MDLRADPDRTMTLYAAEPGSATGEALRPLASWAAAHQADPTEEPAHPVPSATRGGVLPR